MIQLAYLSSTPALLSREDIAQILLTSRQNNTRQAITGMLVYKDGNVLQLLEGEKHNVDSLYKRIERDPRHRGLIRLYEKEINVRDFPDWTMGFRDLNARDCAALDGFSEVLSEDFDMATITPSAAQKLLKVFKAGIR